MSAKNRDEHNRWRNVTVAFRVSPEEDKLIETAVRLSGLTKQDYITRRLTDREVVVQGNPRVFKALRNQLTAVLDELRRIEAGKAALSAFAGGDVEIIRVHRGVRTGEDDRLRLQRGDLFCHMRVSHPCSLYLAFASPPNCRYDHRRMRHHIGGDD